VGQAEINAKMLKLLKDVRGYSDRKWKKSKPIILAIMGRSVVLKRPDASQREIREHSEKVGEVLEEARGMEDVDFELSKDELAKKLSDPLPEMTKKTAAFQAAFFLIGPGSADIYDVVLARKEPEAPKIPTERPRAPKPT
jgi:hypothetical protein